MANILANQGKAKSVRSAWFTLHIDCTFCWPICILFILHNTVLGGKLDPNNGHNNCCVIINIYIDATCGNCMSNESYLNIFKWSFFYIRSSDMQKVENLLPAVFQVKMSAYWENKSALAECSNFCKYSENFRWCC